MSPTPTSIPNTGALQGVKVLDLSRILGGPLAGQILGDHGADVLKAGAGTLALRFPADVLNAKLGAPYALRDLSLSDQTRLSLNEHRHEALDIPVLP